MSDTLFFGFQKAKQPIRPYPFGKQGKTYQSHHYPDKKMTIFDDPGSIDGRFMLFIMIVLAMAPS